MISTTEHGGDPHGAEQVARALDALPRPPERILLWGEMGVGKSTLAVALGTELARRNGGCLVLGLDPGSPHFGPPGAISAARFGAEGPTLLGIEALCTLDAVRFRLPLVAAAQRLTADLTARNPSAILFDPPGVTRGVGCEELLTALMETLRIEVVLALVRESGPIPLISALDSQTVAVLRLPASPLASRPPRAERAKRRTRLWEVHLREAEVQAVDLRTVPVSGTPPPADMPHAWAGHQAALLDPQGKTLALGEVEELAGSDLRLRLPPFPTAVETRLLIRDAMRNPAGQLVTTLSPSSGRPVSGTSRPSGMSRETSFAPFSPPVASRAGWMWATLMGGAFGDPLLHVRLRHRKRSLLIDLGDAGRLPARLAHQVTDVFLSHAHLDHVGGFPWFLRSRLGSFPVCRVFGPPGTIERIGHFLAAITWDRIGDNGAAFEVIEVHATGLRRTRLQPGKERVDLPDRSTEDQVILDEPEFTVRAAVCDHGISAVAYALSTRRELNVRKDRLAGRGLSPGPWLAGLKQAVWRGECTTRIALPDGTEQSAGELAEELVLIRPGEKMAYVADAADTPQNRERIISLARGAHTLFCEAAFTCADRARAEATQHLTTTAAAEIAVAAGVGRLAPFHFSRRYERDPTPLWNELRSITAGRLSLLGVPPLPAPRGPSTDGVHSRSARP